MKKKKKLVLISIIAVVTGLSLFWLQTNFALFRPDLFTGSSPKEALLSKSSPLFAFERDENNSAIIFAKAGDPFTPYPIILSATTSGSKKWQLFEFKTAPFKKTQWIHVARGAGTAKVWALAENQIEETGPVIEVVLSEDHSQTWRHISTVTKPVAAAKFHTLQMDKDGAGQLVLYLSDDSVDVEKIGYYLFATKDWGKTWTGPRHLHDIMLPAHFTFGNDYETADVISVKELMENESE